MSKEEKKPKIDANFWQALNEAFAEQNIDLFGTIEKEIPKAIEKSRRGIDFTKGIALGLIYGIIGNVFVQFIHPVLEGLVLQNFDAMFLPNLIVSVVALIIIVYVSFELRRQLKKDEQDVKSGENVIKIARKYLEKQKEELKQLKEKEKESK